MESTLKCKLRKSFDVPIQQQQSIEQEPEKSSLIAYLFGILFGSKFVFLLLILGIIALYVYYSQSSQLEENKNEENKDEIKTSELEIDGSKGAKKKKKINYDTNEELIIQSPHQNEEIHVSFSSGLNTIHEINESQNDELSSQVVLNIPLAATNDELEKVNYLLNKIIKKTETVPLTEVFEKIMLNETNIIQNNIQEPVQLQEKNVRLNQKENMSFDDETKLIESVVENIYSEGLMKTPVLENSSNNKDESTRLQEYNIDTVQKGEDNDEMVESIMELKTYLIEVNKNDTDKNYEIMNLLNSITVSTQGKNEPAITIIANDSTNEVHNDDNNQNMIDYKLINQDSIESSPEKLQSEVEVMKSEVNIQYKHPNVLQQINISDCDERYVEFDDKTNRTVFNDNFKESLEDLSYDREEMGSRISLQTDKTIDSSIDDLSNLEKMNKQFEIVEKKSSSDGSDKFEILDKNELSKTSSNENEFELINTDRTSTTNSHNDDNSNINYQDEADGISNRLKEQFSSNSLLGLYQVKHLHAIADNFTSLNDISKAIRDAGLEKSQLIFGIDFTISNLENGEKTFNGRSLHYYDENIKNPYQKVIEILGKTLECFDIDGKIPAFGFGDSVTKDRKVFPFVEGGYCDGFAQVLESYNRIVKNVQLSGPTNFAPLIRQAIKIVESTHEYHILVIVADGQVTNARQTKDAIVEASKHALSIVMVGVGDGPWDTMEEFDDLLPVREFDNFQFVNYHEVIQNSSNPDEMFALNALMEIPDQYKAIKELGLLNFKV